MPMLRQANLSIKRVIWISFLVDLSDIVLSVVLAVLSGSVVMISQALQGLADLATSGLLLVGVYKSSRRANRQYQFGYGRDLFFWVLVAAVCMFVITGGLSFSIGLNRYLHPEAINNIPGSLVVLVIGLLTNLYAFSLSFRRLFADRKGGLERLVTSSMVEAKTTLFLDGLGSVSSLLGFISLAFLLPTNNNRLDGIGAMLTGLATASLAVFIIHDARTLLVGRGANRLEMRAIREATLSVAEVRSIRDLRTMHLGSVALLVNLDVGLSRELHTHEIEIIMEEIKSNVKKRVPNVAHIQVEVESASRKA